jgi:hypothetical protein
VISPIPTADSQTTDMNLGLANCLTPQAETFLIRDNKSRNLKSTDSFTLSNSNLNFLLCHTVILPPRFLLICQNRQVGLLAFLLMIQPRRLPCFQLIYFTIHLHRLKPVIAIQCLIAKAAYPGNLQYVRLYCTQNGDNEGFFFMILIALAAHPVGLLYAVASSVLQCFLTCRTSTGKAGG